MSTQIFVAAIAAIMTAVGWIVTHALQSAREDNRRRDDALLKYTERQLEELYGPLILLVIESRRTFRDLLDALGRNYVFSSEGVLSDAELATWIFWSENDFMPRNERIKILLTSKTHLIESEKIPESFVDFLNHHNSWHINHLRWTKDKVPYSWHSKIGWPRHFEADVIATFELLKKRHAGLVRRLSSDARSHG